MFCPRCGQQQASGDLRFCSRCGLPMRIVSEVVANGGTLPQLLALGKKTFFSRRNGALFSLFWFIFFVLIMTPFWGINNIEELAAMSAITGVFGGLMILLFSLLVLKKPHPEMPLEFQNTAPAPAQFRQNQSYQALPPQQTQPAQDYVSPAAGNWRADDTGEMVQPGTVTDDTTKLLATDDTTKLLAKEEREG